jgi:MFS family permease
MAHRQRHVDPSRRHRAHRRRPRLLALGRGALLLGAGIAMVYPTFLATIGDVAHPLWRASSVGVYRLWRDGGFAVGALLAGAIADALGMAAAIWAVVALTAVSGLVVAARMYETHRRTPNAADLTPEPPAFGLV